MKNLIENIIIRPFKWLLQNPMLIVFSFIIIGFNRYSSSFLNGIINISPKSTINWFVYTLPNKLFEVVSLHWLKLLAAYLIITIMASVITVVYSYNMVQVFLSKPIGHRISIKENKISSYLFFFATELVINFLYGASILLIYILVRFLYINFGLNALFLFIIIFLLYPLYYLAMSFSAFISVIPMTNMEKVQKITSILRLNRLIPLYIFYCIRLLLEAALVILIPIVVIRVVHYPTLASISITIGLMIPFAFFRNSSIEMKLNVLRQDNLIRTFFHQHYSKYYDVNE